MSLKACWWAMQTKRVHSAVGRCVLYYLADATPNDEGKHSFPSVSRIAEKINVSVRTIQRELRRLEDDGLIRRGDQRYVSHIKPQYRPVVWDLDISGDEPESAKPAATNCRSESENLDSSYDKMSYLDTTNCHPNISRNNKSYIPPCSPPKEGDSPKKENKKTDMPKTGEKSGIARKLVEEHHARIGSLGLAPRCWPRREIMNADFMISTLTRDGRTAEQAKNEIMQALEFGLQHDFHRARVLTLRSFASDWAALRQDMTSPRKSSRQAVAAAQKTVPAENRTDENTAQKRKKHTLGTPCGRLPFWCDKWSESIQRHHLYDHFDGKYEADSCPVCGSDSRNAQWHGIALKKAQ